MKSLNYLSAFILAIVIAAFPNSAFAQQGSSSGEWQAYQDHSVRTSNGKIQVQLTETPTFEISEVYEGMEKGSKPGTRIVIPDVDNKKMGKAWSNYLSNMNVKTVKRESMLPYYFSDNAMLATLSENTVDIYTHVEATPGGAVLKTFVDLGGVFVSARETPEKANVVMVFLVYFSRKEFNACW